MQNVSQSTGNTGSPPPRTLAPGQVAYFPKRDSFAAETAAVFVTWFESCVHAHVGAGVDQVSIPILRAKGPAFLPLTVDVNGAYTVVCDDLDVVEAALACQRAHVLDELLGDIRWDVEAEHLFDHTTVFADVPAVMWTMARVAERILDRAASLPAASVAADAAFATALGASLNALAFVTIGDLLWACERRVMLDVFDAWRRLCSLVGRPSPELSLFKDAIGRQVWTRTRLTRDVGRFDAIRTVVRSALQMFDQTNSLAEWRELDRAIRGYAELEAECEGTSLAALFNEEAEFRGEADAAPGASVTYGTSVDDVFTRARELGRIGRTALGQGGLR